MLRGSLQAGKYGVADYDDMLGIDKNDRLIRRTIHSSTPFVYLISNTWFQL